jgi:hypothetical protein
MYSQNDMFQPVLGGPNKIVEEAVPRFLNDTLKTNIPLLIHHMCQKTSVAAPEKKLVDYTQSELNTYQRSPSKEGWMSHKISMMTVDVTLP